MTRAVEIRVEGLEASRAALEAIIRQTKGDIRGSLDVIGQQWVSEIAGRAPVRTGTLRRSYTYEVGSGKGGTYVEVSSNVVYAPYQEFGTSRIVGTPHVRPGTDAVARKIPALIVEGVRRGRGPGAGRVSIGGALRRLGG